MSLYIKGQPFFPQFSDPNTGALMAGGTIEFYLAGTSTPTAYYTDSLGTSGGSSITLDSGGMPANDVYYDSAIEYKIVAKNSSGSVVYTVPSYKVIITSVVSVKDFGATGDGVTDDTDAIVNCISSSAYKRVYWPKGTYLVSSDITLISGTEWDAESGAVIDGGATKAYDLVIDASAENVSIKGLSITRMARALRQGSADLIKNIFIEGCKVYDCNDAIGLICAGNNVHIHKNNIYNISNAGETSAIQLGKNTDEELQGAYYITNNKINGIENTSATSYDTHGVLVRGFSAHISHNTIENVIADSASGTGCEGIYVVAHYSQITHNTLRDAGDDDASIILKGGADDGVISQGSFGFNNIVSHNTLVSSKTDASAIETQADQTLITKNIIQGYPGSGDGITVTANSNSTYVDENYFIEFEGATAVNFTDSKVYCRRNVCEYPKLASGTFTMIRVNSSSNAIDYGEIVGNTTILSSGMVAAAAYMIFFDADTNPIKNIEAVNTCINESYAGSLYMYGWDGASGVASDDVIIGGKARGTFADVVRLLDVYPPTNLRYRFDLGADDRTANGATTIEEYESSRIITNDGASGTITAALPASRQNLEYRFTRTDSQNLRIDPNGSETIRGGGAGKYLSLDSDGASAHLKCFSAGTWEVLSSNGTVSYEA